jgi:hypothetical protein
MFDDYFNLFSGPTFYLWARARSVEPSETATVYVGQI